MQVIALAQHKVQLQQYPKDQMAAIAPNLAALVGPLVGARLIARAGRRIMCTCLVSCVSESSFRFLAAIVRGPRVGSMCISGKLSL